METNVSSQTVETKKPSLFGMIMSPTVQFERMRTKAPIGLPLILMMVIMSALFGLFFYQFVNADFMAQMDEAMKGGAPEIGAFRGVMAGVGVFMGLIVVPIGFLIAALLYKIVMVIMGNDTSYKTLLSFVIFMSMITAVQFLVNNILIAILGSNGTASYTSLASLFPKGGALAGVAQVFDLFYLWYFAVMAIGLPIVTGISKKKSYIFVGVLFVLMVAVMALSGAAQSVTNSMQ
ncbi:YIP1 family protein [Microbacteriaceae bacterium 4G12]